MKLSDFKGIFHKSSAFFESAENVHGDYYIIKLKPQPNISWRPGEHAAFTLPGAGVKGKKWRAFSIASIPGEGVILIGTRTGKTPSSFKQHLINMKKGDKVNIYGPLGWFVFQDDTSPMVLIASGVGITPIRALLKELEKGSKRRVEIIHAARGYHLFEDELKSIAKKNDKIRLCLTANRELTGEAVTKLAQRYGSNAYYYISGSRKVIKSIRKTIKSAGINRGRIITDPFFGY